MECRQRGNKNKHLTERASLNYDARKEAVGRVQARGDGLEDHSSGGHEGSDTCMYLLGTTSSTS